MALPKTQNLTILMGKTFDYVIRWETDPIIYKPISYISQIAPCTLTVIDHGVPNGWRVAVICAKGMTELNAKNYPPNDDDYNVATVVDADHIVFNAKSCACFKPYVSGGYIQYYTPQDLSGYTARMSIKDKISAQTATLWRANAAYTAGHYIVTSKGLVFRAVVDGTSSTIEPIAAGLDGTVVWESVVSFTGSRELMSLTTDNLRILLDNTNKIIRLNIDAMTTSAITWKKGIYELEVESSSGVVTALLCGNIAVSAEVATNA